jgi:hypothetical protein
MLLGFPEKQLMVAAPAFTVRHGRYAFQVRCLSHLDGAQAFEDASQSKRIWPRGQWEVKNITPKITRLARKP